MNSYSRNWLSIIPSIRSKSAMADRVIYTDGSSDGRIAWYDELLDEWGSQELANKVTSNEAEYLAIYAVLSNLKEGTRCEVRSDSQLIVNQLNSSWHIKEARLRELFDQIHKKIKAKNLVVTFVWVRREENKAGKYLG